MIVYVDTNGKIRAINSSENENLISYDIDETHMSYPFRDCTEASILACKISVREITKEIRRPLTEEELKFYTDRNQYLKENGQEEMEIPKTKKEKRGTGKYMVTALSRTVEPDVMDQLELLEHRDYKVSEFSEENSECIMETANFIDENSNAIVELSELVHSLMTENYELKETIKSLSKEIEELKGRMK